MDLAENRFGVCVLKSIALEKDSIVNCDETWCKVRKYNHYKKCYI